MSIAANTRKKIKVIIIVAILVFCEWLFFRTVLGFGNYALFGDRGDGRLTNLLTEHWWNFFRGKEKFSEIAMFYPAKEAFGYTDLFLGYGLVYSCIRLIGLNMFRAYKYTLLAVHAFGTASMYYLMSNKLKCNVCWSLFATMAFCFSGTYANHFGHTQLNAISFLPMLLILIIGFFENYSKRKIRNLYAYSAIFWFVLLTYNSWYIACFTGFFALILAVVYALFLSKEDINFCGYIKEKIRTDWKDYLGYIIFMGILYIPFIRIYVPVMRSSSGYSYDSCIPYLPEFIDVINVSENNLMLGWFIKRLGLSSRGYSGEVVEGFSIVLIVVFLLSYYMKYKTIKAQSASSNVCATVKKTLEHAVFISIIVGIFFTIRLSCNGTSMWWFAYKFIPVVRSMRAVARFLLWLSFPMSVFTGYIANKYIKSINRYVFIILLSAMFISNINLTGVHSAWNEKDELSFLESISNPPEDAEVLYIVDSEKREDYSYIYQLDAFEIATLFGLKTINGYSGQSPSGWDGIWNPCTDQYECSIYEWINTYDLKNVYAYDRARDEWISLEERKRALVDDVFLPRDNMFSLSTGLNDYNQGDYAWTTEDFKTTIVNDKIQTRGLNIQMRMVLSKYLEQDNSLIPYLEIYVDGELVKNVDVIDDYIDITIPMTEHDSDEYNIEVKTNCYFNPKDIGESTDNRDLSIAMYYIGDCA